MTGPVRRRRRVVLTAVGAIAVTAGAWAVWAHAVVQTPHVDTAAPVDAVLVLGGLDGPQRTARALDLVHDGLTRTVVISVPPGSPDRLAHRTCADPPAGVRVVCFTPDPSTTRGEAREIGRLVDEHDWTRVAVVTSTYHVSRSRLIVGRCFHGTLLMLDSGERISAATWAYQWVYQTAGFLKAEILQGC